MCRLGLFLVMVLLALGAQAGPFGLDMGMSRSEIEKLVGPENLKRRPSGSYEAKNVPKPHSSFLGYLLTIDEEYGLCNIAAVGNEINTSVYGSELKSAFERIEEQLKAVYGENRKFDHLRVGSIWNEPKDWMMSLRRKERRLVAFWSEKNGSSLKDGIEAISLRAYAVSSNSGLLSLRYEFQNFSQCAAKRKAKESEAL